MQCRPTTVAALETLAPGTDSPRQRDGIGERRFDNVAYSREKEKGETESWSKDRTIRSTSQEGPLDKMEKGLTRCVDYKGYKT